MKISRIDLMISGTSWNDNKGFGRIIHLKLEKYSRDSFLVAFMIYKT
jgi:hypothetical protein